MAEQPSADSSRGSPLYRVFLLSNLTARVLESALKSCHMTPSEYGFYSLLDAEGAITPSEAAVRGGMAATTVSYLVRRLEERGHVTRTTRDEDRRSAVVALTEEGRRALEAARDAVREVHHACQRALEKPTDEVSEVLADLERALRTVLASREE